MSKDSRFVDWGHWGITFWTGDRNRHREQSRELRPRCIAGISFPVGVQGPQDGFLGSPEREAYKAACTAWIERGELPEGACCDVAAAWLYDETCPDAIWTEGYGWTSPVRVGKTWVFPTPPTPQAHP